MTTQISADNDNYLVSYGACSGNVTGSMHLVSLGLGMDREGKTIRKNILLDCGSFQGIGSDNKNLYLSDSLDVGGIDYIFLSHSHLDHVGRLPVLAKRGFNGKIICTPVTRDITKIVLEDSLKIQDEEEELGGTRLWDREDLEKVKDMFDCSIEMDVDFPVWSDDGKIVVRFLNSEHIIGSASILIEKPIRLLYTGDLGGGKGDMHTVPKIPEYVVERGVDYLMIESTYGDRIGIGDSITGMADLKKAIDDMRAKKGKLLIAAMAIDRTEEILRMLKKLGVKDKVYLDSVMGADILRIYIHNKFLLSKIAEEFDLGESDGESDGESELKKIFRPENFEVITSRRRSKEIADSGESCVIIASSGMLEGGRIMEHLPGILESDNNILMFTGYQAMGTLGREILDGRKEIAVKSRKKAPHWERNLIFESNFVDSRLDNKNSRDDIVGEIEHKIKIKCDVRKIGGLSAHADQMALLNYIDQFKILPGKVFLVHGEKKGLEELERKIREKFRIRTIINEYNTEYPLMESGIVEKVVVKDISNVDKLVGIRAIKFHEIAGKDMACFAGWIMDGGVDGYKLLGEHEVQKMIENRLPGGERGERERKDIIPVVQIDKDGIRKDDSSKDMLNVPGADELFGKMIRWYGEGYISKGLVKGLILGADKGGSEYRRYIEKRIKGRDLIIDDIELERKGMILEKDKREKLEKEIGDMLIRAAGMDMKALWSILSQVMDEIKDR